MENRGVLCDVQACAHNIDCKKCALSQIMITHQSHKPQVANPHYCQSFEQKYGRCSRHPRFWPKSQRRGWRHLYIFGYCGKPQVCGEQLGHGGVAGRNRPQNHPHAVAAGLFG